MSDSLPTKRIAQFGLSEVYSAPEPQVDIILVHGLNGHPVNTWSSRRPETFWPADLLPQALADLHCRILTYGYDANVSVFTDGGSKDKIHHHAEQLAGRLVADRTEALERPIIFICHSLGGLLVKRCLIHCNLVRDAHMERLRSIYVSTYGILFLGTPQTGSGMAKSLQSICAAMMPKKFFDSSPQLINALKTNHETLQNINRLFVEIIGRFHVYFFYESKPMDSKGTRSLVVDEDSAAPVIEGVERMGIERDHSHMCTFEDENAPGYDVVAEAVQRYANEAPRKIRQRWDEEQRIRQSQIQGAARELLHESRFQNQWSGIEAIQQPRHLAESLGVHQPKKLQSARDDFSAAAVQSDDHTTLEAASVVLPEPKTKPPLFQAATEDFNSKDSESEDLDFTSFVLELKHWKNLLNYMDTEFDRHTPLDEIVVLVGNDVNAWCTTCGTYVQWRWDTLGQCILGLVNSLLSSPKDFHVQKINYKGQKVVIDTDISLTVLALIISEFSPETDGRFLSVRTSPEATQEVAEIIAWIFSALSLPVENNETRTGSDLVTVWDGEHFIYKATSIDRRLVSLSNSICWHPLFPHKVLATGSIPDRPTEMNGLEIDYNLLVQISGVDLPILEDNGIYLDGYLSVLCPIMLSTDMKCLQWHLTVSTNSSASEDSPNIGHGPPLAREMWYRTKELRRLSSTERHFLGWCTSAVVTLGTDMQRNAILKWSEAKARGKSTIESSTNLNLNLSFHGIGATAGKTFKRGRHERNAYENHEQNFLTAIRMAKQTQVLLYRPSGLQAWLVPKTSVLLQLVLTWMNYMMKGDSELSLPIFFADKSSDGGETSFRVLKNHMNDILPFGDLDTPCRLSNVVRMFLFALGKLLRLSDAGTLYGWEMNDLVDPPEFFEMKEGSFRRRDLTMFGGWSQLLPKIPLILFYEGLEDPIVANSNGACSGWVRMPANRNLLGITLTSLEDMTRRFQSGYLNGSGRLTDKCYWHCPGKLFEQCKKERHDCNHVQMIYLHGRCNPPTAEELERGKRGAVVFESGAISWHV